MSSETERFTTEFTIDNNAENEAVNDTKSSIANKTTLEQTKVVIKEPSSINPPNTVSINGIRYIKTTGSHKIPSIVRVTDDIKARIDCIAAYERRKVTAIIEKALDEFIEDAVCEPRPYLPFNGKEATFRMSFNADRTVIEAIETRAAVECRSTQDLFRRAIINYIEKSPFDPQRIMKVLGADEVSGNLPDEGESE